MINLIHIEIASKLAETILQTRLQVKKTLFKHLRSIVSTVHTPKFLQYSSLSEFLNELIPDSLYCSKEKLSLFTEERGETSRVSLCIVFTLVERTTCLFVHAESWFLRVSINTSKQLKEPLLMTGQFFSEIILILNKLPLFSVYYKDRDMRNRYILKHQIIFEASQQSSSCSIFDLRGLHFIERSDESLHIYARVAYCPSFGYLKPKSHLNCQQKRQRKQSQVLSEGDDHASVYVFYDPELDFVFLTSDEQNMHTQQNAEEMKISIAGEQPQFELLIQNEDQDFLSKAEDQFDKLAQAQQQYLS